MPLDILNKLLSIALTLCSFLIYERQSTDAVLGAAWLSEALVEQKQCYRLNPMLIRRSNSAEQYFYFFLYDFYDMRPNYTIGKSQHVMTRMYFNGPIVQYLAESSKQDCLGYSVSQSPSLHYDQLAGFGRILQCYRVTITHCLPSSIIFVF